MLGEIDYFVSAEAGFFAVLEVAFFVVEAGFFAVDFFAAEAGFWVVDFLVVDAALRVGEAFAAGASVFGSFRFFQRHHSKCRMNQHSQPSPFLPNCFIASR